MNRIRDALALVSISMVVTACGSSDGTVTGGSGNTGGSAPGSGGMAGTGGDPAGSGGGIFIGSGGGGGAPACKATGEACVDSGECCDGACNKTGSSADWLGCRPRCAQDSECDTGCCLLFSGQSFGFCTAARWCQCGVTADRCGTMLPECCADQVCVGGDAQGSFYECRPRCTQASECATACCVAIPGLNQSACLDPSYCP